MRAASNLCAFMRMSLGVGEGGKGLCRLLKCRYKRFASVACLKGPAGEGGTWCSGGGCRRMCSGS